MPKRIRSISQQGAKQATRRMPLAIIEAVNRAGKGAYHYIPQRYSLSDTVLSQWLLLFSSQPDIDQFYALAGQTP